MNHFLAFLKNAKWHSWARKGTLIAKLFIYLFLFIMIANWTFEHSVCPYNWCIVGIELAIIFSSAFTTIRMGTIRPFERYVNPGLKSQNEQLLNLLSLIVMRIKLYNQRADYYFTGVRIYKYITMILSGISTILLGLNISKLLKAARVSEDLIDLYAEIAKNAAFVIGAVVTVYTGIMTYWNIEKYWLQSRSVANKLITLKEEIENEDKAGELDIKAIKNKYKVYETITGEYNKYVDNTMAGRSAQEKNS